MNNNPHSNNREVRIYISSTFCGMQEEREFLDTKVFPQLQKLCEKRDIKLSAVDLRLGYIDEVEAEKNALSMCIDEIDLCRPFFIGLLGEHYGWVPLKERMDAVEKEKGFISKMEDKSIT
jgi:hypothetical protein